MGYIYNDPYAFKFLHNERKYNEDKVMLDLCPKGTTLEKGGTVTCEPCH